MESIEKTQGKIIKYKNYEEMYEIWNSLPDLDLED